MTPRASIERTVIRRPVIERAAIVPRAIRPRAIRPRAIVPRAIRSRPIAALLAGLSAVLCAATASAVPRFDDVRAQWRSSDARLVDRQGRVLQTMRIDPTVRRLDWLALDDASPAFRRALLLSEDRRFLAHAGIEWQAVGAALADAAGTSRAPRGASTITMQLAGLLDGPVHPGRRSVAGKFDQAATALALERSWTKAQILEAYVNLVPFRGELVGLRALSELQFGRQAHALDAREAALAAALIRGPNAPAERVARRACLLLTEQAFAPLCAGLEGMARVVLARPAARPDQGEQLAPHLGRRLLSRPGTTVVSTLDAGLQRVARDALRTHLREVVDRRVGDGAVIVLDNRSGEVLAWVGSSGPLSEAPEVDAVLAPRQAGSTLKPFLYGLAIAQRRITAASLLEDTPLDLPVGEGSWIPRNHDRTHHGLVSARTALAASLNVPAVRVGRMVTPAVFARTLQDFGLTSLAHAGDHYGYSLALGAAEVTLLELANAYRTLANGGRIGPVRVVAAPASHRASVASASGALRAALSRPARTVLDPAAAFVVADILSDRNARALTFGWDSLLATRSWAAVKTGTSKDLRDNWCLGFTDRYTVGVWVGNAGGAPMRDVSGAAGAAPVWAHVVAALHGAQPSVRAGPPPGTVRATVRFTGVSEPEREEWFLAGTQTREIVAREVAPGIGIDYPTAGMVIALDPDIPPANQRLRLRARTAGQAVRWELDGRTLAPAQAAAWFPAPGRHTLRLLGPGTSELDRVEFEVRGVNYRDVYRHHPRNHRRAEGRPNGHPGR